MKRVCHVVAYILLAVLLVGVALFGLHICADHDHDQCPICAVFGAAGLLAVGVGCAIMVKIERFVSPRYRATPHVVGFLAHVRLNC